MRSTVEHYPRIQHIMPTEDAPEGSRREHAGYRGVRERFVMDWFDRRVVEYVVLWAPYGPLHDEDVFPEFGMGVPQLCTRFDVIVARLTDRAAELDELDRALVAQAGELSRSKWTARTANATFHVDGGIDSTKSPLPMPDY
jgi:hypothetical protein